MVMTVVMTVVPTTSLGERSILSGPRHPLRPLLTDKGDQSLACGGCGFILAERLVSLTLLEDIVFECPRCSVGNMLPR